MRLPRLRFTILSLMIVVVMVSLVLTIAQAYFMHLRKIAAVQAALANYQNARLSREVAEIAVVEYQEGIFKQELELAKSHVTQAEGNLGRARDKLDAAKRLLHDGKVSQSELDSDAHTVEWSKHLVDQAVKRKNELEQVTKRQMVKEVQSEVAAAKADELAKKALLDQLQAAER